MLTGWVILSKLTKKSLKTMKIYSFSVPNTLTEVSRDGMVAMFFSALKQPGYDNAVFDKRFENALALGDIVVFQPWEEKLHSVGHKYLLHDNKVMCVAFDDKKFPELAVQLENLQIDFGGKFPPIKVTQRVDRPENTVLSAEAIAAAQAAHGVYA